MSDTEERLDELEERVAALENSRGSGNGGLRGSVGCIAVILFFWFLAYIFK